MSVTAMSSAPASAAAELARRGDAFANRDAAGRGRAVGARESLAHRGDRRGELGRMVTVVVDDRHAGHLRNLEPPTCAGEKRRATGSASARGDARELERSERSARVAPVVIARHARAGRRRAARRARPASPSAATARTRLRARRANGTRVWWSSSTLVITAISAGSEKTVRSDSSPSTTSHPSPAPAFAPSCGTGAPISQAGSRACLAQDEGDHRRDRSFPVRAGDDDRTPQTDELGQKLRPPPARDVRIRTRDDDLPAAWDDRSSGAISSSTPRSGSR